MKKQFHTSSGIIEKELTQQEIEQFAAFGDAEARREICKQEFAAASTVAQKIDAIKKYLVD